MKGIFGNGIQKLTGILIPNQYGLETKPENVGRCRWDGTMIW